MNLDATVSEILAQNRAVTLDALGGIAAIDIETADSVLFPHVADAVVASWPDLSPEDRKYAESLFRAALGKTTSGLALNDICLAIVPHASDMGIALPLKDALRDKVAIRTSQASGALAATALRWLAHLAIINDEARPALADVLVGVARAQSEVMSFAVAAAQVAAITYDCWRDSNATACLDRLTNSDAEADAWFGLGRARLVDALEARSQDTIVTGLREARTCFEYASTSGDDRIDAALYCHILRFVTEWASGAPPAMLGAPLAEAEAALLEYVIGGSQLPAEPTWLRPRFEAENAWIVAVRQLRRATDSGRDAQAWYAPAVAISALAEAYCTANSFRPRRASADATATSFADLVAPRLAAPFLANADRLAYVEIWLTENDNPDANVFVQMVRTAANAQVMLPKAGAIGKHPAVEQLLGVDPAELPDGGVLDLIEMRLQDRAALDRLKVRPVVRQVIESTLDELSRCLISAAGSARNLSPSLFMSSASWHGASTCKQGVTRVGRLTCLEQTRMKRTSSWTSPSGLSRAACTA